MLNCEEDGYSESLPPMFDAAIPVLAVTEMTSGFLECFLRSAEIIALSSRDFPVPTEGDSCVSELLAGNERIVQRTHQQLP